MPTRRYHAVPMPPIRPTGAVSGWWSPNHRPSKLSAEPPVTSVQPLWRLVKDGHVAEARVRPIAVSASSCGTSGTAICE